MTRSARVRDGSRRTGPAVALAAMALLAFAPSALASHGGATVYCGSAGTYTLKVAETGNGSFQAPAPGSTLLFEEGGGLTVFEVIVDGQLRFSNAVTGREKNGVTEVQCSFEIGSGQHFEVTGILRS